MLEKQDINIKFTNYEEVNQYAQKTKKTLLVLDDRILDVTSFAQHHPGGGALLYNQQLKSIDQQMKFHHPLSLNMANSMAIGSLKQDFDRLIDPRQPLLKQVWNLDEANYLKIINSPMWLFIPSPRMFESNFFQAFSHNKWYTILLLPILFIAYLFYNISNWSSFNLFSTIIVSAIGFLAFTLTEYCLHRFIFHSQYYLPDNRLIRYLHFILHGIHHMLPNDPDRLVYPPALAIITFLVGLVTVVPLVPITDPILKVFFWSFFLIGYMTYDCCHYFLHHTDTSKNSQNYFARLQKYHNQHHFGGQERGFGVSSKLWDIIFRTEFTKTKAK